MYTFLCSFPLDLPQVVVQCPRYQPSLFSLCLSSLPHSSSQLPLLSPVLDNKAKCSFKHPPPTGSLVISSYASLSCVLHVSRCAWF